MTQTQPAITSIPVNDFELDSNNSVFRARIYAIWNPVQYTVRYDPCYSIDDIVSDENNVPASLVSRKVLTEASA